MKGKLTLQWTGKCCCEFQLIKLSLSLICDHLEAESNVRVNPKYVILLFVNVATFFLKR